MDEDGYLMWLSRIDGIGIKKQKFLLEAFGNAENIWYAKSYELKSKFGINDSLLEKILLSRKTSIIEKYKDELYRKGISFISIKNELYPSLLKEIFDPPIGLYVKGTLPSEDIPKVSIIGSRKCSEYGVHMAYKLSKDLGKENFAIISGMAKGIDTMAHKGAIDGKGKTIAVLGCGADICYPSENRALYENIINNGAIVSEYPPGTKPIPGFFPVRNRIISGLSSATIVIEAGKKSGTLITVDQALEQGRDVYAVPGNVNSKLSEGTNDLIKQGATLISTYKDVINALGIKEEQNKENLTNYGIDLASEEKLVYDCISFEPITVDNLAVKLNINLQKIQYILTMLELKEYIQRLPGQRYIRSL